MQVFLQSAMVWTLILSQMAFGVLGHGLVVVCHDDDGSSHIELIHDDESSGLAHDICGQTTIGQVAADSSLCTGTSCVDEFYGLTFTFNSRRSIGHGSLSGVVPTGSSAIVSWMILPDSSDLFEEDSDLEDACVLKELQRLIRTNVLVL